ncbi:dynamin 1-like protein [Nematocida displodere]|uniref:Dynamin 1-like protein n=1 Tax=Nematocida displodere TaxID=1805483 RepID=A0A177EEM5_9MICR|nr:dynamin 1-like protein [Nematocida displodere]
MEELIEKVNELQGLCADLPMPINLPQIVVVGAQSSGKSSILENIVGGDFLPRGPGMVTKRPLMIQIVPSKDESSPVQAVFGHAPHTYYHGLEGIREEIANETNRLLGDKNDVSAVPIVLKVYRKKALPLTLIDLPGMVKVRAEGQPEGIVKKIDDIIRDYVRHKNTIILAVTPATTDLSSSDGLMMAKEFDPGLERTLCVLTKVDLMDPGTNLISILQGKVVKVKLGFIPVICRGELALKDGTAIADALAREKDFFSSHSSYASKKEFCGMPHLLRTLHTVLRECIVKSIPYLQERIDTLLEKVRSQLGDLGPEVFDRQQAVMQMIMEFKQTVDAKISGTHTPGQKQANLEIVDGARISYTVDVAFSKVIRELNAFDAADSEMETVLFNASGVFGGSGHTLGLGHFLGLALNRMQPHCLSALGNVVTEMQLMMNASTAHPKLSRFPRFRRAVEKSIAELLRERSLAAAEGIKRFLHWNALYIRPPVIHPELARAQAPEITVSAQKSASNGFFGFASNPGFSGASGSGAGTSEHSGSGSEPSPNASISLPMDLGGAPSTSLASLKQAIHIHTEHMKNTVVEQVPKIIVYEIVHQTVVEVQNRLIRELYHPQTLESLLEEEPDVLSRRQTLSKALASLEKALLIILDL